MAGAVHRLSGVSIRVKLLVACGGLALLTGLVGGAGLWTVALVTRAFREVATEALPAVTHLVSADREMQRALVAERTLMFMKMDSPAAREQVQTHEASLTQLAAHWKGYAAFPAGAEERKLAAAFEKARAEWEGGSREVLKLLAQDSAEARKDAIDVSLGENSPRFEAARKGLAALGELRRTRAEAQARAEDGRLATIAWLVTLAVAGAMGIAAVVGFALARSIGRPLEATVRLLRDIAEGEGDLTRRLEADRADEVGELSRWFNVFMDRLADIMAQVREAAAQVALAAQEMSAGTGQLSSGAQNQASSLEETAASMEELAGTVRQNADNARQASELAGRSRHTAEAGGQVVTEAAGAMDEITRASRRITDIITTIDEIAFQTNLLALNAAVEAARAGEQGRGFAVVAAEVRNLAQRSAGAAREIKDLIRDSVAKVETGSALVKKSGETLTEIVTSVTRVADLVGEIAAASQEQAAGIDQVNRAVTQMDQVTQANAAQTHEQSSTAQAMAQQARDLQDLVGRFKLDESAPAAGSPRPGPAATARRPAVLELAGAGAGAGRARGADRNGVEEI